MDVMEAVRQTHVQLDRLFEEVNQVKQQFKALQQQGNRESGHSPARHNLPAFAEQQLPAFSEQNSTRGQ